MTAFEPVAWMVVKDGKTFCVTEAPVGVSSDQKVIPLYAEPSHEVLRDAERYRWLRDGGLWCLPYDDHGIGPEFDLSEEAVDAAMAK